MAYKGSKGTVEFFDDFHENNIATTTAAGVRWLNSSDAGNTAFAVTPALLGMVAQAATDATDDDMCEIAHAVLGWSGQNGQLGMETRVRVSVGAIGSIAFTVGFNDDALEDSNTLPVELATATFTSNAASFAGVVFDADATNQDFHVFWVDDTVNSSEALADLRMTASLPVISRWYVITVVLDDRGTGLGLRGTFTVEDEISGLFSQKVFNTSLDRDALLTPHIAFENRAGVAHTFNVDYVKCWMSRPSPIT